MAERIRKTKAKAAEKQEAPQEQPDVVEERDETLSDIDSVLDEIDSVLEVNAEEFVKGFIQKGASDLYSPFSVVCVRIRHMEKRCPDCDMTKPLVDFPRNRSTSDGYGGYCKPCHNARTRANIKKNHGNTRYYHLRRRYGITPAEFDALAAKQNSLCAICGERPPTHLDHCHETNRVRGLLCVSCNNGIGLFKDRADWLAKAADYVQR